MICKKIAVGVYCLLLSVGLSAAELKIGVVDLRKLVDQSTQKEKSKSDLQREFQPRETKLVNEQKEIKRLEEKLEKDAAVLSDSEKQKLERGIIDRKRDAKRLMDEFREDYNLRASEEMMKLQKVVTEAIQSVAKEQKFDLVLVDGIAYASEALDITREVEKKLGQGGKR